MSKKIFHSGKTAAQYRESSQKYWNIVQSKKADEKRTLRKYENNKKYGNVVEILTKEIIKRPNIENSYRSLLPVVRELIESSNYLSARFCENDIESITVMVVRKVHDLLRQKSNDDLIK